MNRIIICLAVTLTAFLHSTSLFAFASGFGCDNGFASVFTVSAEAGDGIPGFANVVSCTDTDRSTSSTDGGNYSVASATTEAGVIVGAGALQTEFGESHARAQGGIIFDFIPRRTDGPNGLTFVPYIARATLIDERIGGFGPISISFNTSASIAFTGEDFFGNEGPIAGGENLVIGQNPPFGIDEHQDFGQGVMLVPDRKYSLTLTGLVDVTVTSGFDPETGNDGVGFGSRTIALSATLFAPAGWEFEFLDGDGPALDDFPLLVDSVVVPLPGALWLLAAPLGLLGIRRKTV